MLSLICLLSSPVPPPPPGAPSSSEADALERELAEEETWEDLQPVNGSFTRTFAWTFQVDPLTTALGFVHVQVERALDRRWSLYLGPSLHLFSGILGDDDLTGLGAEVGVRRYLTGRAPHGWWLLVRGVGAWLQSDARGRDETAWGGYGSLLAGYTAIFDDFWVLSGGLGVQYLHYTVAGQGPVGVLPAAHTAVGVAF